MLASVRFAAQCRCVPVNSNVMRLGDALGSPTVWAFGVLVAGALSIWTGLPSLWSPYSLPVVIPAFLVGALSRANFVGRELLLSLLAAAPVTLAYVLWVSPKSSRSSQIPTRSLVAFLSVAALVIIDFLIEWPYATQYRGATHTYFMVGYNLSFLSGMALLWSRNRRSPGVANAASFHGIMFCWVAWCAFPYLGELP